MNRLRCLVSAGLLFVSPMVVSAATIFSNADPKATPAASMSAGRPAMGRSATAVGTKPGSGAVTASSATKFVLTQPMLIMSITTQHTTAKPSGSIKLLRDGTEVYSSEGLATTASNRIVVQPFLVFAPGNYVIETTAKDSWAKDSGGNGIATVTGEQVSNQHLSAVTGMIAKAGPAFRPFSITSAIHKARIDPNSLKQGINDQTKMQMDQLGGRSQGGGLGSRGQTAMDQMNNKDAAFGNSSEDAPKSGASKAFEGLTAENLAPSEYTDTFGGERFNRGKTGSPGDFSGGGRGNASDEPGGGGGGDDITATIAGMLTDGGGKVTGDPQKDAEEAAYMMSVGSDGWAATKDMTKEQRASYWEKERNSQLVGGGGSTGGGAKTPNENGDETSGSFRIFGNRNMRRGMFMFQAKAISARKGAAGERQASESGGPMRQTTGQDDKPVADRSAGTINWDAVMKINQVVNPTRQ